MRMFVKAAAYDSITSVEEMRRARAVFGEKIEALMAAGKVKSSGVFGDMRGGYCDLELDSVEEFNELIGDLADFARLEPHPVASFESLAELFEKSPPRQRLSQVPTSPDESVIAEVEFAGVQERSATAPAWLGRGLWSLERLWNLLSRLAPRKRQVGQH